MKTNDPQRVTTRARGRPTSITTRRIPLAQRVGNLCELSVAVLDELAGRAAKSPDGQAAQWSRLSSDTLSITVALHWLRADLDDVLGSDGGGDV
jgi:hypothetical protein